MFLPIMAAVHAGSLLEKIVEGAKNLKEHLSDDAEPLPKSHRTVMQAAQEIANAAGKGNEMMQKLSAAKKPPAELASKMMTTIKDVCSAKADTAKLEQSQTEKEAMKFQPKPRNSDTA